MEETQLISAVIFWNELLELHMISVLFELVQVFILIIDNEYMWRQLTQPTRPPPPPKFFLKEKKEKKYFSLFLLRTDLLML